MEKRPELIQGETENTLAQGSLSEPEKGDVSAGDTPSSSHKYRRIDFFWVFCILVMLGWPWAFVGVLWAKNGIQLTNRFAKVVTGHPRDTNYVITLLASITRLLVSFLFSKAVLRFAQAWMTGRDRVTIFHVSLISALQNQSPWPWGSPLELSWKGIEYLLALKKLGRVLLVVASFGAFLTVPSGITSLITPFPFNETIHLTGTELDFASTASDCLSWLDAHPIPNNCDWKVFRGLNYTNCLGQNQQVDVLESGRSSILSLISNYTEVFSQLGADSGLQFSGPIRGVLPTGPNGVPAFDTLNSSVFSDPQKVARMLSYNYTLGLQGLSSSVSCLRDTQSPINISAATPGDKWAIQNNGDCERVGAADFLNVTTLISMNSLNLLTFWACKSLPDVQESSYFIYLQGRNYYESAIGNITCTISPIQPAIFPVTYQSNLGIFSTATPIELFQPTFYGFIEQSVVALASLVTEAQNMQANLVAESIITFGVKSFHLPAYSQDPEYLKLYAAMIQGVMEYEATYTRLLYSAMPDRPSSCDRTLNGTLKYSVLGWSAKVEHIGTLMPMTIVNLVSLVLMILAICKTKSDSYEDDLTGPRPLVLAQHNMVGLDLPGLADRVRYQQDPRKQEKASEPK